MTDFECPRLFLCTVGWSMRLFTAATFNSIKQFSEQIFTDEDVIIKYQQEFIMQIVQVQFMHSMLVILWPCSGENKRQKRERNQNVPRFELLWKVEKCKLVQSFHLQSSLIALLDFYGRNKRHHRPSSYMNSADEVH